MFYRLSLDGDLFVVPFMMGLGLWHWERTTMAVYHFCPSYQASGLATVTCHCWWSWSPSREVCSDTPTVKSLLSLSTLEQWSRFLLHSPSLKGGDLCCPSLRVMYSDKSFSILLHGSCVYPVIYPGICLYLCGLVDVYFVLFYFVVQIVPALATGIFPSWFLSPSTCSMFVGFVLLPGFLLLWNGQAHLTCFLSHVLESDITVPIAIGVLRVVIPKDRRQCPPLRSLFEWFEFLFLSYLKMCWFCWSFQRLNFLFCFFPYFFLISSPFISAGLD